MNSNPHRTYKAVFQGGGCKAVSYIGAYREALQSGVSFSEVSGSSGGSIVAAFIAAGATPDDLIRMLRNFDVARIRHRSTLFLIFYFLLNRIPKFIVDTCTTVVTAALRMLRNQPVTDTGFRKNKWQLWHFIVEGIHMAIYGYIYPMDEFEKYIDLLLQQTLGINHTVHFRDLRLPLSVFTTDIYSHNYKVFSTREHPDMSVAHAIAASCAIPGYFKPVEGRYVDGCMVSNLPVFTIAEGAPYDRVLAITTDTRSIRHVSRLTPVDLVTQIAETIGQAGVNIQMASFPSAYNVRIPTDDYDMLEFAIIHNPIMRGKVIDIGAQAMHDFLQQPDEPDQAT